MTPVLRTLKYCQAHPWTVEATHLQIGRAVLAGLVLPVTFSDKIVVSSPAKTGGKVPPTGPLIRLLSVISKCFKMGLWRN